MIELKLLDRSITSRFVPARTRSVLLLSGHDYVARTMRVRFPNMLMTTTRRRGYDGGLFLARWFGKPMTDLASLMSARVAPIILENNLDDEESCGSVCLGDDVPRRADLCDLFWNTSFTCDVHTLRSDLWIREPGISGFEYLGAVSRWDNS